MKAGARSTAPRLISRFGMRLVSRMGGSGRYKWHQRDVDAAAWIFPHPPTHPPTHPIGRLWQCSTIQCDFNLPERFDLEYVADDGTKKRPIMVHRAIFGSLERFFGILVENTAGK